jgi:DUF971 family protein
VATAKALTIRRLRDVGRYAIGVDWSDGHDSILPFRQLRPACPCDACRAGAVTAEGAAIEIAAVEQIGDATVFLAWQDGHESLFLAAELRPLCRCAHCIGEPSYPITGQ